MRVSFQPIQRQFDRLNSTAQRHLQPTFHVITMNATAAPPLFATIELAPRDPILGITEAFNADKNPAQGQPGRRRLYDDNGKVPLLDCVRKAEANADAKKPAPRTYLPIDGLAAYDKAVQELVFGADSAVVKEGRASPCKRWAAPAP